VKIVVVHESRTGNTRLAGELIGGAALQAGHEVHVYPADRIHLKELAEADLVFMGTWVDGLILFGHRPGGAIKLARLVPRLDRKPVAAFTTHAYHPGKCAEKWGDFLRRRGADVVVTRSFHRRKLTDGGLEAFVDEALGKVPTPA
jgi:flavodoxin